MYALDPNVILLAMVQSILPKLLTTFLKEIFDQLNETKSVLRYRYVKSIIVSKIFYEKLSKILMHH